MGKLLTILLGISLLGAAVFVFFHGAIVEGEMVVPATAALCGSLGLAGGALIIGGVKGKSLRLKDFF